MKKSVRQTLYVTKNRSFVLYLYNKTNISRDIKQNLKLEGFLAYFFHDNQPNDFENVCGKRLISSIPRAYLFF